MGVGHELCNGCEWCAHGCGCWVLVLVWCGTCGHVDIVRTLKTCALCWCGVGVFGGVVVGCCVGVLVKWSPMAVASRLMGVRGVGCWCGHCPMLGGVVVGVARCGNVGRTSHIATGMGSPPHGMGQGEGVWEQGH